MKKHRKAVTFFRQKSYLLAAVLMLAAVFGMTGVYFAEEKAEKKQQAQLEQEQLAAAEREKEEQSEAVDQVIPPQDDDFLDTPETVSSKEEELPREPEETPETPAEETTSSKVKPELHFNTEEMGWPMSGNVIMNYSMDRTVYFATLDQYKYNPALVIQGKVNDKVCSVADGKVSNIEKNEVTGLTVTVDLGDGYSAVYGQLKEVPLSAGDHVNAKDVIGYISEPTKYYSVEGPNLYFQMIKDNKSIDPMEFLQ